MDKVLIEWETTYGSGPKDLIRKWAYLSRRQESITSILLLILIFSIFTVFIYVDSGLSKAINYVTLLGRIFIPLILGLLIFSVTISYLGKYVKKKNSISTQGICSGSLKKSWEDFQFYEACPELKRFFLYYANKGYYNQWKILTLKVDKKDFEKVDRILQEYLKKEESACTKETDIKKSYRTTLLIIISIILVIVSILLYIIISLNKDPSTPLTCLLSEMDPNPIGSDNCYRNFAIERDDIRLCEKVRDQFWRDWCYHELSVKNGINYCSRIENQKKREQCYILIAPKDKNLSSCDQIMDPQKRRLCYEATGEINSSVCDILYALQIKEAMCKELSRAEFRRTCYESIAEERAKFSSREIWYCENPTYETH